MNRFALLLIVFAGCSGAAVEVPTPVQTGDLFESARTRSQAGDDAGAIEDLTKLLEAQPDNVGAFSLRGSLHLKRDEYALAIADLERAVLLAPESPVATNDLAWLFATCPVDEHRNGKRAVELAKLSIFHSDDSWEFGDTLAAALAEAGDFSEAIRALTIAMEDAPEEYLPDLQKRMLSYQQRKPWRE